MTALAVVLLRLVQYSAASVLMGSALFFAYALPFEGPGSAANLRWPRPLLLSAAILLAVGTIFGLVMQTAELAGSLSDALTADSLTAVVTQMDLGKAALARTTFAMLAAICIVMMPRGRSLWFGTGILGTLACITLGWMGHGGATEGAGHIPHLAADIVHVLAAALWLGALAAFAGLVSTREQEAEQLSATATALQRFSPIGIALVAAIAATGLINGWYLVGTDLGAAIQSAYGQLLALKLVLFAGMLALAALHRQRSVPALTDTIASNLLPQQDALASLRRSLLCEAILGFAVLAVVGWFGTLEPPMTMGMPM